MKQLGDLLSLVGAQVGQRKEAESPAPPERLAVCPTCGHDLKTSEMYRRYRVCESCNFHFKVPAKERIEQLVDHGSFKEVNQALASVDPLGFSDKLTYRERLAVAQQKTGLTDAVVTGTCRIHGKPVVLAVLDFEFMGGSMGSVVGEKVALAFELALRQKTPMITVATSGGARMQEGILSLMQMAKTAAAAKRLSNAGIPFISVLANPTTGGIYASFANLGDIIVAEPGALIGFNGPRVIQQTMGSNGPINSHSAEFLMEHGMVDQIINRPKLRDSVSLLLEMLYPKYKLSLKDAGDYDLDIATDETPWEVVQLARHKSRPTSMDYITRISPVFFELHGDRLYGDDPAVVTGFIEVNGQPMMVIGQERGHGEEAEKRNEGRAYPEGYRKAMRAMNVAAKFKLPILTLIDTPGAYPGLEAEERGIAVALASCLATMSDLPTPIVSVVIGEGGSGGALALAVADRILIMEHAIYSVISPEGCAAILYHDASKAEQVSSSLRLTARDAKLLGVVDVVIAEPEGGAHGDADISARQLKDHILREFVALQRISTGDLIKNRYRKFRKIGQFNSFYGYWFEQVKDHLPKRYRREDSRDKPLLETSTTKEV